ncbi:hypothetical protein QR680_014908 [Steinernema hermaphroditum]|uniref:non-specific serine/threonine protein kinase n=1 Tax=Steinernema hermaphroditum TaxID=289476 RepID=A0AA39ID44_9BILA|nr:hypothetical protein QR680_014908 [Steinernema hermaphroditum]
MTSSIYRKKAHFCRKTQRDRRSVWETERSNRSDDKSVCRQSCAMGELIQLDVGRTVNGWKVQKKLGEGAFGAVYRVTNQANEDYALKVEGMKEEVQLLKMEVLVLTELAGCGSSRHFLKMMDKGQFENFNYMVIQLVGKSLADLRLARPQRKFSMGTAISVGIQCLEALEDLHNIGYLHRDVKPGNFTTGRKLKNELRKIYVLDFGMARKFVHTDGTMKKPRTAAGFRGTVKYAPLSCHYMRELCRKDDVETWLYMVIELTKGSLPWRNIPETDDVGVFKKDCRKGRQMRMLFGGCPREYIDILRLVDAHKFFDAPDYPKIYGLMRDAMASCRSQEYPYDWEAEALESKRPGEKVK